MPRQKKFVLNFSTALEQLQDVNTALATSTLAALSGPNHHDVSAFAKTWVQMPLERRRQIAQRLVELAEENFEIDFNLIFRYLLNDEDAQIRTRGIEGLWEDEDAALVKPLIGFLRSDPNATVRAAAADALGRFMLLTEYGRVDAANAPLIGDALLATVRSGLEDLSVRCRAVEALAYWSDQVVRDIITAAYAADEIEMRASAVAAMGRSADSFWRKLAADELDSPDARLRFEAARTAGELENRAVTPRLIELLDDPDREVQSAAVTALGQIGGSTAKQALMRASTSDDEVLSELADEALQELEFVDGSPFLLFDMDSDEGLDEMESDGEDAETED